MSISQKKVDSSTYSSTLHQLFSRQYFLIYCTTKKMQYPFISLVSRKSSFLTHYTLLCSIKANEEALLHILHLVPLLVLLLFAEYNSISKVLINTSYIQSSLKNGCSLLRKKKKRKKKQIKSQQWFVSAQSSNPSLWWPLHKQTKPITHCDSRLSPPASAPGCWLWETSKGHATNIHVTTHSRLQTTNLEV